LSEKTKQAIAAAVAAIQLDSDQTRCTTLGAIERAFVALMADPDVHEKIRIELRRQAAEVATQRRN